MRVTDICEVARSLRIIDLSEVMSGVNIAVAVIYPALSSPLLPPSLLVDTISLKLGDSNLDRGRGGRRRSRLQTRVMTTPRSLILALALDNYATELRRA